LIIKDVLAGVIADAVEQAARDGAVESGAVSQVKIEYPKEESFGDYSTPIAMESARVFRKSPLEIGARLKPYIEKSSLIGRVDVVKPGFINMFLSNEFLFSSMKEILRERDNYGRNRKETPRRVNIEFVSANPTGPLNIVSARAASIGDTLANLMECNGDMVEREFYVNDYGNQVDLLGLSTWCRYRELKGEKVEFPENGYHGEYVRDIARHVMENFSEQVDSLKDDSAITAFMSEKAIEYNVKGQKEDLGRFNIEFKRWFHEKILHERGAVEQTFELLKSRGVTYQEEGKMVFRSTDYGDDKDRVIIRDDGRPTYLLADMAYHRDKIDRGYDLIIDIWGPDHHGYIARLAGAVKAMGFDSDRFRVLIAQQVNLIMEGEMVKMSKRLGTFSSMRELIDEIGTDVARYFFIMRSIESHLDFDLALAKRQSSENPVFYLQYAHARICSIFREAEKRGYRYVPEDAAMSYLENPESVVLLKLMARFPEEISDAAGALEPHRITNYLLRLAQGYHKFYAVHRVLADDPGIACSNLALCDCVRTVLKNGLRLLGVSAPERM
jgi:arginyl-tRNA synthetase